MQSGGADIKVGTCNADRQTVTIPDSHRKKERKYIFMSLTKEKEQQIVEMYQSGVKAQQIERELSVTGYVMYGVLRDHGIELRRPKISETRQNGGGSRKKAKTKRCPVCKANNNPVGAKFCCMCGTDIRSDADIVSEKLDKAMKLCIQLLPVTATEEVVDAMRQAKQLIERAGK